MSAVLPEPRLARSSAAAAPPPQFAYDAKACRALMRGGSKTFFAASLLLPQRVRAPASALYAFCRRADDEIDLGDDPWAAMRGLQRRLDDVYAGRPQAIDCDRALAAVVHRHAIPRAMLDALLEGFLWDAQGRRYETLAEVQDYGARVAGTVGAMMALVMGVRDAATIARACELGVAMQLTNIARDIGEDARLGRLYLPRQWLREAGLDPDAWLAAPCFDARLAGCIARLLASADELYARAELGIRALPRDCRPAIRSARLVYAEIGRELERMGMDSVARRAVVPGRRKLALIAQASGAAFGASHRGGRGAPAPLPAIRFLAEAGARHEGQPLAPTLAVEAIGRVGWVIELLERQIDRQRLMP